MLRKSVTLILSLVIICLVISCGKKGPLVGLSDTDGAVLWKLDQATRLVARLQEPENIADKRGLAEECYGSITAEGYCEKNATLAVSRKVGALLEQQAIPTALTRAGDRYLSLDERVAITQQSQYRGWIFVSIHFNRSSRKQKATGLKAAYRNPEGFEIYILPRSGGRSSEGRRASRNYDTVNRTRSANRALAQSIAAELDGIPGVTDRGVKEAWFIVLRGSPMPAILIEGGFMSNPDEGRQIASDAYQWKLARAIVEGILKYRSRHTTLAMSARGDADAGVN